MEDEKSRKNGKVEGHEFREECSKVGEEVWQNKRKRRKERSEVDSLLERS